MKYKNTSGFRQVLIIEGKKQVVFADDVVEVSHDLINPSFEKVADSQATTFKPRTIKKANTESDKVAFLQIENKLDEVRQGTASVDEMTDAVSKITTLEQTIEESTTRHGTELGELRKDFSEFKLLVLKRLEILKSVVSTLEYEVGLLYPDEEAKDDSKPFRTQ